MTTFIFIIALVATLYLTISGLYQFILALASKTKGKSICKFDGRKRKMLVLVPAYQEDRVIIQSTKQNMSLKYGYPKSQFDYVVISDGLKPETNKKLEGMGAEVLPVGFEKSTKAKSLQVAMHRFQGDYEGVVILDADNVVEMNFLFRANHYLSCGHYAVQGLRKAANMQTSIALMDGLSETANTEMLCKGANRLGFSSKLSGSGMVFDYAFFKSLVFDLTAIGGFDKELELEITKRKKHIHFAEDVVVYDEKVSNAQAFAKQRGRWLQAQYSFFGQSFISGIKSLAQGNLDHFHKVMQLALPPRVMAPVALAIISVTALLLKDTTVLSLSLTGLFMTLGAYLIVLPTIETLKNAKTIIKSIPKLICGTCKALTLIKKSKETFLHTQHELVNS